MGVYQEVDVQIYASLCDEMGNNYNGGEFNLDEMEDGEIWINSSEQAGGENFCCSSELEHIKVDYKIRALFIFYGFPHYLLCSCIYVFISKCQIMLQKVMNISEQFSRPSVTMAA